MFLVGPVLAVWALVAANRSRDPIGRIGLMLSGYLFMLGAVIGFGGVLTPRDPSNAESFLNDIFSFFGLPHVFLALSAVASAIYIFVRNRLVRVFLMLASFTLGTIFVWQMSKIDGYYGFADLFRNRAFMVVLLPAFVGIVFSIYWIRPKLLLEQTNGAAMIVLIPFTYALIADIQVTWQWNIYIQKFCEVLDMDMTPQERIEVLISGKAGVMGWTWTHPTLSSLLRDLGNTAHVANQQAAIRWEPYSGASPIIPYRGFCQSRLFNNVMSSVTISHYC
jgi:hypothetical protein